jgi:hypothetical protein
VILLKTKEKKRDVNMQRKKSDNNNNNSRKTRKKGEERLTKKKDWNFFPRLSICTGKITEIRRSSVCAKCARAKKCLFRE